MMCQFVRRSITAEPRFWTSAARGFWIFLVNMAECNANASAWVKQPAASEVASGILKRCKIWIYPHIQNLSNMTLPYRTKLREHLHTSHVLFSPSRITHHTTPNWRHRNITPSPNWRIILQDIDRHRMMTSRQRLRLGLIIKVHKFIACNLAK